MPETGNAIITLPSETSLKIERVFDAPAHLVWQAWTTPELVKRWWSGRRGVTTIAEIDLRVGGTWRYVMTTNDGMEVAFHGEYREVVPHERLVCTEVFELVPDDYAVTTLTLTETGGRTLMEILVEHTSTAARDGHLNSGMETGMNEAMDALEVVAIELGTASRRYV